MKHYTLICTLCTMLFFVGCKKNDTTSDKCKGTTCLNGGTCTDGSCVCSAGFEGTDCGILSRTKFIGSYSGFVKTAAVNDSVAWTVTISENAERTKVNISSLKLLVPNGPFPATTCSMEGEGYCKFTDSKYDLRCYYGNADKSIRITYGEANSQYIHLFNGKK